MRLQKVIPLDNTRSVVLNELNVRTGRQLLAQAKELENIDIKALLTDRFDEVVVLLGDCVVMPEGETIDDLSFSEIPDVIEGLMEVNESFLELMGLAIKPAPAIPSTDLTEPVSLSSSEGTQA
ncbi:hypothetical protein [Methylobacter sp.]|uniref:hypothetical protein n=1 Tax=Methylobacter sp. TaxID=2051955 RepID=UPI003DA57E15